MTRIVKTTIATSLLAAFLTLPSGCTRTQVFEVPTNYETMRREYDSATLKRLEAIDILTLDEALQIALENNPDYRAAFQAVNAARYRYYESLGAFLPRLNADFGLGQSLSNNYDLVNPPDGIAGRENHFGTATSLQASWLLFDGLAREFSVLIAKQEHAGAIALDENARRVLLRAVSYAYYDVILARELERIALADIEFQESSLLQSDIRLRYGLVALDDVLNFKIRKNMAKSSLSTARYRSRTARYALATLMGYPAGSLTEKMRFSSLAFAENDPLPDLELSIDLALQNRPDLQSYRILLSIAGFRRWQGYAPFMPTIHALAGLNYQTWLSHYGAYHESRSYYNHADFSYGAAAQWNLFEGFRAWNELRARTADEQVASLQLENKFLECVNSVQSACANLANCREQVKLFREMLDWVFQQRQLVNTEYLGGRVTITRLNEAQRDLIRAESDLAVALADYSKARAQYEAAINAPVLSTRHQPEAPRAIPLLTPMLEHLEKRFAPRFPIPDPALQPGK